MSRRLSLGGRATPLGDGSRHNIRSSSRATETPLKDRRALLEEWRQSRSREYNETNDSASKRPRILPDNGPPLPPAAPAPPSSTFVAEGTTALERFRMRKQLKVQQQQHHISADESFTQNSSICYDDSDETRGVAGRAAATPGNRRLPSAARRKTMLPLRPRTSLLLSQETDASQNRLSTQSGTTMTMSQLTVESDPLPKTSKVAAVDTVEDAGLRSRVREMEQRVEQLEKEKMVLSMAKAPLEARFRQREDEWLKEQSRLVQEIESIKVESRQADERYRDLKLKYEAADEEVRQLRLAVRKASSSLNSNSTSHSSVWDHQLQNDRDVADLKEKLRSAAEELDSVRLDKVSVEKELYANKIELDSLAQSYDELQKEYEAISESTSENRDAEIKLEVLTTEHIATSAQLNAVCADLAATKARAEATLEAKVDEHKKEVEQLHFEMSVLKTRAGKIDPDDKSMSSTDIEDEAVLKARIEERDRRIAELEAEVLKGEELRRQMHNRIQELRGNIRVYVRTRPFLPSDKQENDPAIDISPDGESLSITDIRNSMPHSFKFDKVFPPSAGQDQVFQEVADFVQSALDGYHVCLFSYGQTGSGKTHTMQGSGNAAMRGIIPRAVEQILTQAIVMQKQKWDFKLSASFLEIYNENLRDLLISMGKDKAAAKNPPKLAIKRNRAGKSYVDGLTEIPIETVESEIGMQQLDALMAVAARARSVASTKMNAQSSRSHSVFMLHLRGYNEDSGAQVHGALNLCDLAGSERLDRSGANSDAKRLRETQAINKSLSCLGDVFNALAQGASHIPFRNSKLTYLLQDCLSGDGKTMMFVNLSPTTASSSESLCSLRFAQRVNQVELGKPTKHIEYKR